MERADHELSTEAGACRYTVFGCDDYRAHWGTYEYQPGLVYDVRTEEPCVALVLQLAGTGERFTGHPEADVVLHSGESNLVVVPAVEARAEITRALRGDAFEAVLSRRYVAQLTERHPDLLRDFGEHAVAGRAARLGRSHLTITPPMWGIVRGVRARSEATAAGALLLESAILELLALVLEQRCTAVSAAGIPLSRRDVEGLHAARDLLLARLHDPPTVAELARHALTNEFKLKRGFRQLFGATPYAYLLAHRLEQARRYLLDTDWPVAQIARRLGYSDPAHLTNAFRKHFGMRPSDLRRGSFTRRVR